YTGSSPPFRPSWITGFLPRGLSGRALRSQRVRECLPELVQILSRVILEQLRLILALAEGLVQLGDELRVVFLLGPGEKRGGCLVGVTITGLVRIDAGPGSVRLEPPEADVVRNPLDEPAGARRRVRLDDVCQLVDDHPEVLRMVPHVVGRDRDPVVARSR